jgi:hypothetical protein
VTVARTEAKGDEARAGEEQRRLLGRDQCRDIGRRRRARVEDRAAADGERERQRVAEPEGEEQLRHREAAVVGPDRQDLTGVGLGRRLRAPVAVHDPLRHAGGAGAVEPEPRRVLDGGGDGQLVRVGERRPRVGRDGLGTRGRADHDGVAQLGIGGGEGVDVAGVARAEDRGAGTGVAHDGRELTGGEHR